jgi:hypothetical protein
MNKKDFVEYILSLCTLHKDNAWHPLLTTCTLVRNSPYVQSCIRMRKAIRLIQNEFAGVKAEVQFLKMGSQPFFGTMFYSGCYGPNSLFILCFKQVRSFHLILYDNVVYKKNVFANDKEEYPIVFADISKNPGVFWNTTLPSGALQKFIIYDEITYLKSY